MADTTIKITQLPSLGNGLSASTILPVVNTSGTAVTAQVTVGAVANYVLAQAGNTLSPAFLSTVAYSVSNSSQPNITNVGTLSVDTLKITGGIVGYYLQTDGSGNLTWAAGNSVGGTNTQVQFNDADALGGNTGFTFNKTTGVFTAPFLAGNGNGLSNIQGANVSGFVANANVANTAFSVAAANVTGLGNIATINLDGNASNVLRGDGTFGADANSSYGNSNVVSLMTAFGSNTITTTGNVSVGNIIGNGQALTNIAGANVSGFVPNANVANTAFAVAGANVSGFVPNANVANTAFAVAAANVSGLGNIATINLDGNASNVLRGDGTFGADANSSYGNSNVVSLLSAFGSNTISTTGIITADGANLSNVPYANLTGAPSLGNISSINLDGNVSNLLTGNGTYVAIPVVPTVGNIATINLTGSNANVLYGNGVFAAVAGGNANTGNVTFDDNIVIGTGDEYGFSGLYLAVGPDSIANGTVQYLRVRGGDAPTHIHLDTGNNAFYDQYFGNDNKFVKLEAGDAGNVVVGTDDANGNSYNWSFTSDGNLILADGNSVIQSIANSSLDPLNPNVSTMVLTPDQGYSSQALVLDPTAPGHIHLRSPSANIDEPSANLFLGGETSSFEVGYYNGAAPNLFIHSGNNTWTFDNAGILTFPGTPRIDTDADNFEVQAAEAISLEANTVVNIYTDTGNTTYQWQFGDDGNLTLPDTTSVIANASITLEANSTGNITGLSVNGDADANLYAHGNVTIVSDSSNTTATWTFGADGNLTLPGNLVIAGNTSVFGTDAALIQSTGGLPIIAISSGANGAIATSWVEDVANIGTSNIASVYANPTVGSKIVRIAVGQNGGPGPNLWDFNANGTTTFPGNLISSGASPAPSISGFNSISGITVSASGNVTGNYILGNGSQLTNVATSTTGNWTLASGVNTVSISVPLNGTYAIWVNGNIPNGIVTYTATGVVTNTNVPVLGEQYGWYYEAGNALVLTSIPNQFVGTQGAISNASPYAGNTANVFTFGITNNSGNTAVVNYGYTKL